MFVNMTLSKRVALFKVELLISKLIVLFSDNCIIFKVKPLVLRSTIL